MNVSLNVHLNDTLGSLQHSAKIIYKNDSSVLVVEIPKKFRQNPFYRNMLVQAFAKVLPEIT